VGAPAAVQQPTSGGIGDIGFGPEAAISLVNIERRWLHDSRHPSRTVLTIMRCPTGKD
jgi:hypothetical protein